MDYAEVLRTSRKKPLVDVDTISEKISYHRETIKKIIPHREPFLLIDRLIGLDLHQGIILGSRRISEDDPVFQGHFPDFPIYPGTLQLEMIGQAGLCLYYFMTKQQLYVEEQAKPVPVRATKVLGAYFLEPVMPGKDVLLAVKKLEQDDYFGTVVGQVISEQKVCSVSINEVCFLE